MKLGLNQQTAITVEVAVDVVARVLRRRFDSPLWFRGELVDVRTSSRGHGFVVLKGRRSRISVHLHPAVLRNSPVPDPGTVVLVRGTLRLWTRSGSFRIEAETGLVPTETRGSRAERRRAAEQALREEGWLGRAKRALPRWPNEIAVVTSPRGAAIHDVRAVVRRRAPWVTVRLFPCSVQGESARESIIRAAHLASASSADLIIATRGGGGADQLDAFDDPGVVRALAGTRLPVISAIGHETDATLTDQAADLRAPTPSAAAEQAVPDGAELRSRLEVLMRRIDEAIVRGISADGLAARRAVASVSRGARSTLVLARERAQRFRGGSRLPNGRRLVESHRHRLRRAMESAEGDVRSMLRIDRDRVTHFRRQTRWTRVRRHIQRQRALLDNMIAGLTAAVGRHVRQDRRRLQDRTPPRLLEKVRFSLHSARTEAHSLRRTIEALSPHRILRRGYAIVLTSRSTAVRDPDDVDPGDRLEIILENGTVEVVVENAG